jgi:hypothetical protein
MIFSFLRMTFSQFASWGAMDIQKMADRKTLVALTIVMKIHPDSLKLVGVDSLNELIIYSVSSFMLTFKFSFFFFKTELVLILQVNWLTLCIP